MYIKLQLVILMPLEFTTNRSNLGSEHSYRHEVQNPINNSKRVLEPDFSNMSDPSVVFEPPGDQTIDKCHRRPFLDMSPGGTSPEGNINLRRGGDIDRLLPRR